MLSGRASETKGTRSDACMRSATRRRGSVIFRTVPRIAPLKVSATSKLERPADRSGGLPASHLARTWQFDASQIALRRRLGQRLTGLYHVNPEHFEGLVAGFCVVNCAFGDLIGFPCLEFHRRLAVDQKRELTLEHVAGFGARMG